jgi:molybdopterin converting factor small subunit
VARGTIRYWAAARAAAGCDAEPYDAATLAEALAAAARNHGPALGRVLERCSFLVDGVRAGSGTTLPEDGLVEVLPPFAGG